MNTLMWIGALVVAAAALWWRAHRSKRPRNQLLMLGLCEMNRRRRYGKADER